ncbi:MAG: TOBE domain-containing protein [Actinomycetes bacterium]
MAVGGDQPAATLQLDGVVGHGASFREKGTGPRAHPANSWPGTADTLEVIGDRVRVRVSGTVPIVAEVTPAAAGELHLADGGPVWAPVKATEVTTYPA